MGLLSAICLLVLGAAIGLLSSPIVLSMSPSLAFTLSSLSSSLLSVSAHGEQDERVGFEFKLQVRELVNIPPTYITGVNVHEIISSNNTWLYGMGVELIDMSPLSLLTLHKHERANSYIMILDGQGAILLNGVSHAVQPHSQVMVPAGTWHGVLAGASGLRFYSINNPPILHEGVHDVVHATTKNLESLGEAGEQWMKDSL